MVWYRIVWYSSVWYSTVWFDIGQYGLYGQGLVQSGLVWYGLVWFSMAQYGFVPGVEVCADPSVASSVPVPISSHSLVYVWRYSSYRSPAHRYSRRQAYRLSAVHLAVHSQTVHELCPHQLYTSCTLSVYFSAVHSALPHSYVFLAYPTAEDIITVYCPQLKYIVRMIED